MTTTQQRNIIAAQREAAVRFNIIAQEQDNRLIM